MGEAIDDYSSAYLVTAPRFLGYSFNPVSFWYLYNYQKELSAMILEVNNTFDERRLYFLKGTPSVEPEEERLKDPQFFGKFKDTWPKDFHVSPFNSRKGSYRLTAYDPFSPHLSGTGMINNTIYLDSSKLHAKLVARVFSTEASSDPATLGYWAGLRFVAAWWWVGFVTFPRIVREAGKLFFRRKLHVWYRPEVLKDTIGRRATNDEAIIASTFKSFLRYLVINSKTEQPLNYISCIPSSPTSEILNPDITEHPNSLREVIDFKIMTPLFFTRLARHSHISEFLSNEILTNDDKDRTFYTSHPKHLLQLFADSPTTLLRPSTKDSSISHPLRWRFLHWLRSHRPTPTVQSDETHQQQQHIKTDIRKSSFSQLDCYAINHEPPIAKTQYLNAITKILLGDLIAFGHPEIIGATHYLLKILASYLFVMAVKDQWNAVLGKEWTVQACEWCDFESG
ncbi:MAG: hypothetical protein Q9178_001138 [Gyalolechia marmorata]